MAKLIVVAHDTEAELHRKLRHARDEAFKNRVKAIILALQGKKRYEICSQLAADEKSVTSWVHRYNNRGTPALVSNKGGYWSIPKMQAWISEHHKKDIPEQTVWYRMNQLDYSYKGARPHPVQGDKDKQEVFKKGVLSRSWSR